MASIANITIKKADGTTDVVYTALTPSAGDKIPARWRANAVSPIPAFRPTFELLARPSGNAANARRVEVALMYPVVQSVGGVDQVVFTVPFRGDATLPQGLPQDQVKEAIYQFGNLLVNALIRQCLEEAQAPT